MKATHIFVQYDSIIGTVLEHEKFGKVIILDNPNVSMINTITVQSLGTEYKSDDVDLLDLLLNHLGLDKNED